MTRPSLALRALLVTGAAALASGAVTPAYAGPAAEGFTINAPTTIKFGEPFSLTLTCLPPHTHMAIHVESAPGQNFTNFSVPFFLPGLTPTSASQLYPTTTGELDISMDCYIPGGESVSYGPQVLTVLPADLPDTGAGASAGAPTVWIGAVLLLLGSAAVFFTRRRPARTTS